MNRLTDPFAYIIITILILLSFMLWYCSKPRFENIHNYRGYKIDLKMSNEDQKAFSIILENDSVYLNIQLVVDDSTYNKYYEGDIIE